jgi:microcystin degradation protein MlrC
MPQSRRFELRLALAGFALESVTFLPETTGIADFERSAKRGQQIVEHARGTNSVLGGYVTVAERSGIELVGLVSVNAGAAAAASEEALEKYTAEIVGGLLAHQASLDGLLLHLHGALATPNERQADLHVLRAIRQTMGEDFPVAVGMDLHGNLAEQTIKLADVVTGYYFSPHTDMARTGERAAELLVRKLRGEIRPTMALKKPGIMLPSIYTATTLEPLAELIRCARTAESADADVLDVSVFCGFAYADVPDCGMSVVVVTDNDHVKAGVVADNLSKLAWDWRERLFKRELIHSVSSGLDEAERIVESGASPVCILEHADRLNDSTYVLREMISRDTHRAYLPFMFDPDSALACIASGAGQSVTLSLAGKSSPQAGGPIEVQAQILWADYKTFTISGPLYTGVEIDVGASALIRIGGIMVSLISVQWSAIDLDCFSKFDLAPEQFDYVVLRSKTHFRHVYEPLCSAIVIIDTPDWGPAELSTLPYQYAPQESFPLSAG